MRRRFLGNRSYRADKLKGHTQGQRGALLRWYSKIYYKADESRFSSALIYPLPGKTVSELIQAALLFSITVYLYDL